MSEIDVAQMLAEAEAEFAAAETEPEDDPTGFAAFSKMCAPSAEQAAARRSEICRTRQKMADAILQQSAPRRSARRRAQA